MENKNIIIGENIYLKFIEEKDTENIVKWRNRDFVKENFIFRNTFDNKMHMEWYINKVCKGEVVQFIIYTKNNIPIGSTYLRDIENHKAEFGIFIGEKEYLGKGIGTEATKLTLNYGFRQLNIHKIKLRVLGDNARAKKCYEKCGFIMEGYFKDEEYIDNKYIDIVFMAAFNKK